MDWISAIRDSAPPHVRERMDFQQVKELKIGHSASKVFFIKDKRTDGGVYLKCNALTPAISLEAEKDRLVWLQGKLPVPQVVHYAKERSFEYLITAALEGDNPIGAGDPNSPENTERVIGLYAAGLRQIHSVPAGACPFDNRLPRQMEKARRNMADHLIVADILERYEVDNVGVLYETLVKTSAAIQEELVFTHGDYSLTNIIVQDGELRGFVDWGNGGVSDKYQDLAIAAKSIVYNYGEAWVPVFFERYGISRPDPEKIQFYQLLDWFI
ncbi:aminoglycoside 3'-phosphotransferase [Paenibacillus ehimensis]|uniref:APH(3') family aminoglycoside O-phosphotransferase n=1 Tax=Paenibacillus ehimensis TaxID=79264 RepID=UPI002DB8A0EE|nr:APH(3') family aminoglycoside O-phosphotransferase [Paenibacillus ehimensis]MEC0211363.1 aminoglycoside 3'-phosphotransferase [Paenibacillus ehimensis]